VVNFSTCPHVSLSILGNEPVEGVLLVGGVEGDWLHAHQVAELLGLRLRELGTSVAEFPSDHIGDIPASLRVHGKEVGRPVAGGAAVHGAEVGAGGEGGAGETAGAAAGEAVGPHALGLEGGSWVGGAGERGLWGRVYGLGLGE